MSRQHSSWRRKNLIRRSGRRKRRFPSRNFHRFPEKMKNLNAGGCCANKRKATNPNILKKGPASSTAVEGYHTNKPRMLVFVAISSLFVPYNFRLHHFSGRFLLRFMLILRCIRKNLLKAPKAIWPILNLFLSLFEQEISISLCLLFLLELFSL